MAKIFTVANQKGGVGKTTTTTALASAFKLKGFKTLLIDADHQCNSSDTYQAQIQDVATLYDVLSANEPISEAIQYTSSGDIVACDPLLARADTMFTGTGVEYILKEALEPLQSVYDYIIIDTHPDFGILTINALTCSDYVIVPITTDRFALQGLNEFQKNIAKVQRYTNSKLKIAGILLVKFTVRTSLGQKVSEIMPDISTHLDTITFDTCIRESMAARQAQSNRCSIYDFAPKSTVAIDYLDLINELLERGY